MGLAQGDRVRLVGRQQADRDRCAVGGHEPKLIVLPFGGRGAGGEDTQQTRLRIIDRDSRYLAFGGLKRCNEPA
jgi:hypothetical protein